MCLRAFPLGCYTKQTESEHTMNELERKMYAQRAAYMSNCPLQTYSSFRPTAYDARGLACDDRQDWLVMGISRTRDSDTLERSNWEVALETLERVDPDGEDHEVHRFGHWGPGWFEIVLLRPDSPACVESWEMTNAVAEYPILSEDHHSKLEEEEAESVWRDCYTTRDRIDYIRDNREQFEFRNLEEMAACVRGKFFAGCPSDLLY